MFYQPQYGTLGVWSSIGNSDYNAFTLSARQRFRNSFTMDFNYTLSNSKDDASGLQTASTTGVNILNPFRQSDNYAYSDFDVRHVFNANFVWQLPFGKGQPFLSGARGIVDTLVGGWRFSGIVRYNTGLPVSTPYDDARWATNWNVQSDSTRTRDVDTCPVRGGALFGCNTVDAFQSFRNARPGETGERNVFRNVGFFGTDVSVAKTFDMPWREGHALTFRMDIFNVFNYQAMGTFDTSRSGYGIPLDPGNKQPPVNFSRYTAIQGTPRFMQFFLRYSF